MLPQALDSPTDTKGWADSKDRSSFVHTNTVVVGFLGWVFLCFVGGWFCSGLCLLSVVRSPGCVLSFFNDNVTCRTRYIHTTTLKVNGSAVTTGVSFYRPLTPAFSHI